MQAVSAKNLLGRNKLFCLQFDVTYFIKPHISFNCKLKAPCPKYEKNNEKYSLGIKMICPRNIIRIHVHIFLYSIIAKRSNPGRI